MSNFTQDQINLVDTVDCWAQENHRPLDKQLMKLYKRAANTDWGWKSVANSSPEVFSKALETVDSYKTTWETELDNV
jgi:hypothetical protein